MNNESKNSLYPGLPCGALYGRRKQGLAAAREQELSLSPCPIGLFVFMYCSYKAHHVHLTEKEILERNQSFLTEDARHPGTHAHGHLDT